ncbi:MAG TPA: MBL fold metallo-hydrolase [Acidothermaceae bacterium]|jgi:L-ascorbate metabolism protein UlaG (beta-lactamase superfamily)
MLEPVARGADLLDTMRSQVPAGAVGVWPLGQSGMVLRFAEATVLVDAYLSNHCEAALARPFDHRRLTSAPFDPAQFTFADVIACSHDHLDHLDVPTIRSLADASPNAILVLPLHAVPTVLALDWPTGRVIGTRAGDVIKIAGLTITAFAVPHETYDDDPVTGHPYQGYCFAAPDISVAHVGDSRADDALRLVLAQLHPDLLCLPINGRDEMRAAMGFAGNMTAEEAVELAAAAGVIQVLPMHDDMFAQNIDHDARSHFVDAMRARPDMTIVRPAVGDVAVVRRRTFDPGTRTSDPSTRTSDPVTQRGETAA